MVVCTCLGDLVGYSTKRRGRSYQLFVSVVLRLALVGSGYKEAVVHEMGNTIDWT